MLVAPSPTPLELKDGTQSTMNEMKIDDYFLYLLQ